MDKKQVALLIKQVDSLYPGRINLEPTTVETWYKVLEKQDYLMTFDVLIEYAKENKFPPTVSDLYIKQQAAYQSNILEKIAQWEREASGKH